MNFTRADQIALALYNIGIKKARDAYAADQAGTCRRGHRLPEQGGGCLPCRAEDQRRYRERKAAG